jgi:pyruvate dehydrogenase E2 component (dihydrolipoamide acetyltransferase)
MPVEILMPSLDPSMLEAMVVKWLKTEGDPVKLGDPIVEIETDKAVVEVEAEASGSFGKPLVAEGDYAPVNSVIGLIFGVGEGRAPEQSPVCGKRDVTPGPSVIADDTSLLPEEVPIVNDKRVFASPLARRLAALEGLELSQICGSGPNGRIVKFDIEATLMANHQLNASDPPKQAEHAGDEFAYLPSYETIRNTGMRNAIAQRLTKSSQQVPHYFLTLDCELDELLAMHIKLNGARRERIKISLNDFFICAAAYALKEVPDANTAWTDTAILRFNQVDISIAVAIDGGLVTPVVRNADGKKLGQISVEAQDLVSRARTGKLLPEEYKGGTFTISNLGNLGIKSFTSIINPPQGAILSVGAVEPRPVVKEGQLCVAMVMTVTLAVDHRCIDGAVGAEFLAVFKRLIETPLMMLM